MNHQERDALRLKREVNILESLTSVGPAAASILARRLHEDHQAIRRECDRLVTENRLVKHPIKRAPRYRRGTTVYAIPNDDVRAAAAIKAIVEEPDQSTFVRSWK